MGLGFCIQYLEFLAPETLAAQVKVVVDSSTLSPKLLA